MGVYLSLPIFKAWDTDGTPAAEGYIYTYVPYTDTPKYAYTDEDCTIPHENPIRLDAYGETIIHLRGATKLVVKNSAGVTLPNGTFDNVVPASLPYEVDVLRYGAAGSQDAVDDAVTAIGSSERVLLFPSGDWPITKTFPSNITVKVLRGARFTGTGTVTPQGSIDAGNYKIFAFTGAGKVIWQCEDEPNLLWWGKTGADLNAAITAIVDGGLFATIFAPNSTYNLGSTEISWYNEVSLRGQGPGTVFIATGASIFVDAENLLEALAETAHYHKPIFSNCTFDLRTNNNDVYIANFTYRIARKIFAERVAFIGNAAANQGVLHHLTENLAGNLGFAYDLELNNCTFTNMNAAKKPLWFELAIGSTSSVNDIILNNIQILGVNRGCATIEGCRQLDARHVKWYTAPSDRIDASGTGGGINAYWEFGKPGLTTETACMNVKFTQCWHEGGSGKVLVLDYPHSSIIGGPYFELTRNADDLSDVWRPQVIPDTTYWAATQSDASTLVVSGDDITTNLQKGYKVFLEGADGNKYCTRVVSSTFGVDTTIVVSDAVVPADLATIYRAHDYDISLQLARQGIFHDGEMYLLKGAFQQLGIGSDTLAVPFFKLTEGVGTFTCYYMTLEEGYSYDIWLMGGSWQTNAAAGSEGDSASYLRFVGAKRLTGGAAALVGSVANIATCEDAAVAAVLDMTIDAAVNNIRVRFTGDVNKNFAVSGYLLYNKRILKNP